MTILKKRKEKGLFYLITVVIMVVVMGISCSSKRPTGMNDFVEVGPEDAVGSGENTDHTFDIGVIYPDVEKALQTEGIDITKVSTENNGENLTEQNR